MYMEMFRQVWKKNRQKLNLPAGSDLHQHHKRNISIHYAPPRVDYILGKNYSGNIFKFLSD